MDILTESAFAKLNLTLDVLDRREDGYHNIRSVMQTISLRDDVVLNVNTEQPWQVHCYREVIDETDAEHPSVTLDTEGLPQDRQNLAWAAAEAFCKRTGVELNGVEIFINKRIPMQAGLGGGSADAAAVLRALNQHFGCPLSIPALCELGASIGSDVPFCVLCGTALVEGRGELLTKLSDVKELYFVVCKPDFSVSTRELYEKLDESFIEKRPNVNDMMANLLKGEPLGIAGSMCNVFEPIVLKEHFEINMIRSMMMTYGAFGAQMTGSGSAVFGLYDSFEYATVACMMLKESFPQVFLAAAV